MRKLTPNEKKLLLWGSGAIAVMLLLTQEVSTLQPGRVAAVRTKLTLAQAVEYLRGALRQKLGREPTTAELKMLVAQSSLETGRWQSMWNWNWGNITTTETPWYTLGQEKLVGAHRYRPFSSAEEGAKYFVDFLARRYASAWAVLGSGNTTAFSAALKAGGYYEGDPAKTKDQQIAAYAAGLKARYALV